MLVFQALLRYVKLRSEMLQTERGAESVWLQFFRMRPRTSYLSPRACHTCVKLRSAAATPARNLLPRGHGAVDLWRVPTDARTCTPVTQTGFLRSTDSLHWQQLAREKRLETS